MWISVERWRGTVRRPNCIGEETDDPIGQAIANAKIPANSRHVGLYYLEKKEEVPHSHGSGLVRQKSTAFKEGLVG
jgi:hypothetical protein